MTGCLILWFESDVVLLFFFQAEDGIRDLVRSRGLGDVYKRQMLADAREGKVLSPANATAAAAEALVQSHNVRIVTYDDWRRLDALELSHGKEQGRPRVKFTRVDDMLAACLLYTSPSPRDRTRSRMPSSA